MRQRKNILKDTRVRKEQDMIPADTCERESAKVKVDHTSQFIRVSVL